MDFDLLIIGAGSAGYNGASLAHSLGLRVGLIDGAAELGGLCILRGCMPSKALLAGANRFHQARHSQSFGLQAENSTLDLPTLVARKDEHIRDFADHRRSQILSGRFPFFHSYAIFRDAHTIELTSGPEIGRHLTASTFLIASGSELAPPTLPGLSDIGFAHSDTVLQATRLPASVVVLGGGAVALEFAWYYHALGSRVTILQRSPLLLKGSDTTAALALRVALEKSGITVHTGTTLQSASGTATGKKIIYLQNDTLHEIEAEEIFYALGRRPRAIGLGLESANIDLATIRPTQQTNLDHVFSAGDIVGPYEVVHLAIAQAEIAVRNAARLLKHDFALETIDYRSKLFVLFTHPELAQVGFTEQEALDAGHDILTATHPFIDHGKSLVMGETDGLVKIVAARPTGEILGASVVGPEASSLIQEITTLMHFHGTVRDLLTLPHYHPTLSEIWTYPAEEIADQLQSPA